MTGRPIRQRLVTALRSARMAAAAESAATAVGNFAIVVVLAHLYPSHVLAGYGASLSVVFALQGMHRLTLVVPAAIVSDGRFRRRFPVLLGAHLAIMSLAAVMIAALLWVSHAATGNPVWASALAASTAILLLQFGLDFERTALIKLGKAGDLIRSGTATLAGIAVACVSAWFLGLDHRILLLALSIIGLLRMAAILTVSLGVRPRSPWRLIGLGLRRQGVTALAQLAGATSCSHAPVLAVAAMAPPAAAAAFVAMRTLYAPIQIILRSVETVDRTRFHSRDGAAAGAWRAIARAFTLSAGLCGLLAVAGPWLIPLVYGRQFEGHLTTFLLWGVIVSLMNAIAAADAHVMHARRFGGVILSQLVGGAVAILLSVALAPVLADVGAAIAAIAGWSAILAGLLLTRRKRD